MPDVASKKAYLAVIVAALGYFVDVYDLVLFSIVRVESLKSLNITGDQLLSSGVTLLNSQMLGMLLGGVIWGIWGDKRGRIQVLFGSILLYSVANILNAYVTSVEQYAVIRFFAGVGLAGEIGAGITLVSELMSKESRGYGTTIVASVGVSGAVCAGIVGELLPWQTAYIIGGVMGLLLLLLRVTVSESGMFDSIATNQEVSKGNLLLLFNSKVRIKKYISCIIVGVPIWYAIGILVTFSPELGAAMGISEPIKVSRGIFYSYIGLTLGDLASGLLSQWLRSRKKAIGIFMLCTFLSVLLILSNFADSANSLYYLFLPLGFFVGYWAVFITTAAEQFGTNLRATVATTAPNFVRGAVVPMTLLFESLKSHYGVVASAQIVGVFVFILALWALQQLKESFGTDLNFIEK